MAYYILIENIKEPILVKISTEFNKDKYVTAYKKFLKSKTPEKLFNLFITKGLYENIESGKSKANGRFSIHRLIACLYYNILGLQIHHISKIKNENYIWNLIPIEKNIHSKIDNDEIISGFYEALDVEKKLQNEQFKNKRQTLAKNDELILDILKMKEDMDEG